MTGEMQSFLRSVAETFSFEGKSSRRTACLAFFTLLISVTVVNLEYGFLGTAQWTFPLLGLAIAYFNFTMVKRLHDAGRSGVWYLLVLIPFVSLFGVLLIIALREQPDAPVPIKHRKLRLGGSILTGIVVLATCVRVVWAPYWIPSSSMKPSLLIGDFMAVGGLGQKSFERGDVIVFRHPVDGRDYIKRLIGLPGDTVQMRDGIVILNGVAVPQEPAGTFQEVYERQGPSRDLPRCGNGRVGMGDACISERLRETLPNGKAHDILNIKPASFGDNTQVFLVPDGQFFFLGDNRDNSMDSRYNLSVGGIGFVPAENLIGRADRIMFSAAGQSLLYFWTWRPDRFFKAIE